MRDNGGHAVALAWSMPNVYDVHPGEVFWAASDVGWVVGHSYIVYAPLLAGATTVLYEGKPIGTPDAGAFWRVIEQHGVAALFTAPTAIRAIRKEDPEAALLGERTLPSLRTLFLAGERTDPDTYAWASRVLGRPVIDHWWQTESGWAMAASCRGLDPPPVKSGSPSLPVPGYRIDILDGDGAARRRPASRGPSPCACRCRPARCPRSGTTTSAARRLVPRALSRLVPHGRRRAPRRGRLPVRDGPHRRRHQRRRPSPLDRRDGGGRRDASRRRRVRRVRRARRAPRRGAARPRRPQGRLPSAIRASCATSSSRSCASASGRWRASATRASSPACPRRAPGKILRATMRDIAAGRDYAPPGHDRRPGDHRRDRGVLAGRPEKS